MSYAAIQMLRDCAAAGQPVPVVVIVISGQAAQLVKQLSPKTVTIVRPIWPDSYPMENGRIRFNMSWFEAYLAPILPWLPYIDYVQFVNEMFPHKVDGQPLQDVKAFYIDLIRACKARGIRCTVLDLAAGNLSDARHAKWDEPDQFSVLRPMLEEAAAYGCILNYHCYNPLVPGHTHDPMFEPEAWVLRPVYWLERVPRLRCVGGESLVPEWKDENGNDSVLPEDNRLVIENIRQVDGLWTGAILAGRITEDQWIGHNPFTDQPGQRWKDFNMNPHLAAQAQYLIRG